MKTPRWKPLKSSVNSARTITGLLETIGIVTLVLFLVAGVVSGSQGGAGIILGLFLIILGPVSFILTKASYVALELLTEIADDTRLQLLALAGDEYDELLESQKSREEPQVSSLENDEMKKVF